jgi:DNA replication protein DnaC
MTPYLAHPGAQPDCAECRGAGVAVVPDGERARARPCACVRACPRCDGTGWVAADPTDRRGPRRRCVCAVISRRMSLFDEAFIPARHAGSTLASFTTNSKEQNLLLGRTMRYPREFRPGEPNRGLVLYGDVGRGKTHLTCALVRELVLEHGVSARFIEFSHLVQDLKVAFERGEGAADLLDPLVRVEVLAIDELGKGRNTEFEGTIVDEVVSRRYNAERVLIATTNYAPGPSSGFATANLAQPARTAPRLVDRLGPRVYSRLEEMCEFLEVTGEDYRQRNRPWARGAR